MITVTLCDNEYWTLINALGLAKDTYATLAGSTPGLTEQFTRQAREVDELLAKYENEYAEPAGN